MVTAGKKLERHHIKKMYQLLDDELTVHDVASKIGISERTVRKYKTRKHVYIKKVIKEFRELRKHADNSPNKCIFPNCHDKPVVQISVNHGFCGLCDFHWSIISESNVGWGDVSLSGESMFEDESFPLRLTKTEKSMEDNVFGLVDATDDTKRCPFCGTQFIRTTYKNNYGKETAILQCPRCGHIE